RPHRRAPSRSHLRWKIKRHPCVGKCANCRIFSAESTFTLTSECMLTVCGRFQRTQALRHGRRLLAINLPRYAELICKHAKSLRPEGFLYGHLYFAVFGQGREDAFRVRRVIDAKQYVESS